jgi:uncharacterized protein with FMN-binding domain
VTRRAPVVLAATSAVLAFVLTFRTHPLDPVAVGRSGGTSSTDTGASSSSSSSSTSSSSTDQAGTGGTGAGSASTPTTSTTSVNGTATGSVESTPYGDVEVKVTVAGSRITDVESLELPEDEPRSQSLSSFAGPELADQVISAQSAQIDGVSGATYTSQAYEESVQSALDALGFTG